MDNQISAPTVYVHPAPAKRRLRGCAAIAKFVGVSTKQIHRYVANAGFSAWREGNRGSPLLAERHEVVHWLQKRREAAERKQARAARCPAAPPPFANAISPQP